MRRPIRHRSQHYRRQLITYVVLLLIVVVFFATVGVKLLISLSLFIANFGKSDSTQSSQQKRDNRDYILAPKILNAPNATNSAEVIITASAQEGKTVTIYVNDMIQKDVVATDTTFETEVTLKKGENSIFLSVEDDESSVEKTSKSHTIFYLVDKPKLEIEFPKDQEKTSDDEIEIRGKTDPGVTIKIGTTPTVVNSEGAFSYTFRLREGENKITVEAVDVAGNIESKTITVIFEKDD